MEPLRTHRTRRLQLEGLEARTLLSTAGAKAAIAAHLAATAGPAITLQLARSTSPAGDFAAVAGGRVTLVGQTTPGARVSLSSHSAGGRITPIGRTRADADGQYTLRFLCPRGQTELTVRAIDARGESAAASMTLTRANQAVVWNSVALQAVRDTKSPPPNCARELAILSVAMFDAINSIDRKYEPYAVIVQAPRTASAEAAVASAAYTTLVSLYPAEKPMLDAQYSASLAAIPNGPAKRQGLAVGQAVADQVLSLRSNDGSKAKVAYTATPGPGVWVPTPPAFAAPLNPQWGQVTPFALGSGAQFQPPPPPALDSAQYAAELKQVMELGGKTSTIRTADQAALSHFWADQTGPTFDPPGHWNQIAENAAVSRRTGLATTTRMFALLNIALADAGIAAWNAKYTYNTWRPVTAIQSTIDPTWQPLWPTPPFPAYVSGHSTFSEAAATVLESFYGTRFAFTDTGDPSQHLQARSFSSFQQAAEEAGMSRIYGGIHYMADNTAGLALGEQIGRYVLSKELLPKATRDDRN
ncbi:MAG: vanadium-dependent haloperoxidase [Isosphaeraceae bacterium]